MTWQQTCQATMLLPRGWEAEYIRVEVCRSLDRSGASSFDRSRPFPIPARAKEQPPLLAALIHCDPSIITPKQNLVKGTGVFRAFKSSMPLMMKISEFSDKSFYKHFCLSCMVWGDRDQTNILESYALDITVWLNKLAWFNWCSCIGCSGQIIVRKH